MSRQHGTSRAHAAGIRIGDPDVLDDLLVLDAFQVDLTKVR
ncbi:hypothetical protein [Streptosporangium sp. NPDC049644]